MATTWNNSYERQEEIFMNRRIFMKRVGLALLGAGLGMKSALLFRKNAYARTPRTQGGEKTMKIFVLTGSPRENGNSNILADHFIKGAKEQGHEIVRFDAAQKNVHPCIACNSCGMDGPCVFKDDFEFVREHIVPADLAVFATPMYYFGISAQLKAVIDRFYAINGQIHDPKKAVLLMTYANNSPAHELPILTHYEKLLDYLGWEDAGRVVASGTWTAGSVLRTDFPNKAYELGKRI